SGQDLPPTPLTNVGQQRSAISPDRRFRALADDVVARVVDSQPTDEQRADLQVFWRDDPSWHQEQAEQAEATRAWFAAAFHTDRLLLLRPDAELVPRRDHFRRLRDEERQRFEAGPGRMEPVRQVAQPGGP